MSSRTRREYQAEILGSSPAGEISQKPVGSPLGGAVGYAENLTYDVRAIIEDPDDPIKNLLVTAQVSFRPLAGVNFITAPVGSRCTLWVDLNDAIPVLLVRVCEVFLFDPCDSGAGNPRPPIVNVTPANPTRPSDPPAQGGG